MRPISYEMLLERSSVPELHETDQLHGFTIVVQDESIFLRTGTNGRKLWSRVGDPVTVSRHGRRDKTIVYGTLAEDGTRLMRQYGRFDGPTFVRYLKAVIPDVPVRG